MKKIKLLLLMSISINKSDAMFSSIMSVLGNSVKKKIIEKIVENPKKTAEQVLNAGLYIGSSVLGGIYNVGYLGGSIGVDIYKGENELYKNHTKRWNPIKESIRYNSLDNLSSFFGDYIVSGVDFVENSLIGKDAEAGNLVKQVLLDASKDQINNFIGEKKSVAIENEKNNNVIKTVEKGIKNIAIEKVLNFIEDKENNGIIKTIKSEIANVAIEQVSILINNKDSNKETHDTVKSIADYIKNGSRSLAYKLDNYKYTQSFCDYNEISINEKFWNQGYQVIDENNLTEIETTTSDNKIQTEYILGDLISAEDDEEGFEKLNWDDYKDSDSENSYSKKEELNDNQSTNDSQNTEFNESRFNIIF